MAKMRDIDKAITDFIVLKDEAGFNFNEDDIINVLTNMFSKATKIEGVTVTPE